jgi:hypothetical protein
MEEARIVQQYQDLVQRSQRYFAGLRELPQCGARRLWQPYFQKTFETYTQLWKYQLDHRETLERNRGLQRWEIGDIAAKIGQLYYHYYLRTSETRYLNESFTFYEAIKNREYFRDVMSSATLFNKKLRYYARFLVVVLFHNKREFIEELMKDLRENVFIYTNHFNPPDANEWQLVLLELESFIKADVIVSVGQSPDLINYRTSLPDLPLSLTQLELSRNSPRNTVGITVAESIIVCNRKRQIKFSELSLDMFRMMQSLEWTGDRSSTSRTRNPHKTMLYRPTFGDILFSLSSCLQECDEKQCMLLYITADDTAARRNRGNSGAMSPVTPTGEHAMYSGGADVNTFSWEDLAPFTRKPFFLIVESESSFTYKPTKNKFGHPLVCLLSSTNTLPQHLQNPTQTGSLFTFFLTAPMLALTFLCGEKHLEYNVYMHAVTATNSALNDLAICMMSDDSIHHSYKAFLENVYLRAYITRFILYHAVVARFFDNEKYLPTCFPEMEFLFVPESPEMIIVHNMIDQVLDILNLKDQFGKAISTSLDTETN